MDDKDYTIRLSDLERATDTLMTLKEELMYLNVVNEDEFYEIFSSKFGISKDKVEKWYSKFIDCFIKQDDELFCHCLKDVFPLIYGLIPNKVVKNVQVFGKSLYNLVNYSSRNLYTNIRETICASFHIISLEKRVSLVEEIYTNLIPVLGVNLDRYDMEYVISIFNVLLTTYSEYLTSVMINEIYAVSFELYKKRLETKDLVMDLMTCMIPHLSEANCKMLIEHIKGNEEENALATRILSKNPMFLEDKFDELFLFFTNKLTLLMEEDPSNNMVPSLIDSIRIILKCNIKISSSFIHLITDFFYKYVSYSIVKEDIYKESVSSDEDISLLICDEYSEFEELGMKESEQTSFASFRLQMLQLCLVLLIFKSFRNTFIQIDMLNIFLTLLYCKIEDESRIIYSFLPDILAPIKHKLENDHATLFFNHIHEQVKTGNNTKMVFKFISEIYHKPGFDVFTSFISAKYLQICAEYITPDCCIEYISCFCKLINEADDVSIYKDVIIKCLDLKHNDGLGHVMYAASLYFKKSKEQDSQDIISVILTYSNNFDTLASFLESISVFLTYFPNFERSKEIFDILINHIFNISYITRPIKYLSMKISGNILNYMISNEKHLIMFLFELYKQNNILDFLKISYNFFKYNVIHYSEEFHTLLVSVAKNHRHLYRDLFQVLSVIESPLLIQLITVESLVDYVIEHRTKEDLYVTSRLLHNIFKFDENKQKRYVFFSTLTQDLPLDLLSSIGEIIGEYIILSNDYDILCAVKKYDIYIKIAILYHYEKYSVCDYDKEFLFEILDNKDISSFVKDIAANYIGLLCSRDCEQLKRVITLAQTKNPYFYTSLCNAAEFVEPNTDTFTELYNFLGTQHDETYIGISEAMYSLVLKSQDSYDEMINLIHSENKLLGFSTLKLYFSHTKDKSILTNIYNKVIAFLKTHEDLGHDQTYMLRLLDIVSKFFDKKPRHNFVNDIGIFISLTHRLNNANAIASALTLVRRIIHYYDITKRSLLKNIYVFLLDKDLTLLNNKRSIFDSKCDLILTLIRLNNSMMAGGTVYHKRMINFVSRISESHYSQSLYRLISYINDIPFFEKPEFWKNVVETIERKEKHSPQDEPNFYGADTSGV